MLIMMCAMEKRILPTAMDSMKTRFNVGYPLDTPIVWVKGNSHGYINRTRRRMVQSSGIQMEAFLYHFKNSNIKNPTMQQQIDIIIKSRT